jgi:hypothetical protein
MFTKYAPTLTNTDASDTTAVDAVAVPVVRRLAPIIQKEVLEQTPVDLAGTGCFGIRRIQWVDECDGVVLAPCISRSDRSA